MVGNVARAIESSHFDRSCTRPECVAQELELFVEGGKSVARAAVLRHDGASVFFLHVPQTGLRARRV